MALPTCPFAADCGLAGSIAMEAALRVWESFYCEGFYGRCERYRLHGSGREVPDFLLPNGRLVDGSEPELAGSPGGPRGEPEAPPRRRLA
jgi:hypothetical protein